MIALILMQRGAGAAAGSGFGGGASATVFGARGSSSFLSKSTKWLAIAFFGITLFMAWYAMHRANPNAMGMDLGVMGSAVPEAPVVEERGADVPTAPAATDATVPAAPAAQAPAGESSAAADEGVAPAEENSSSESSQETPQND